MAKEDRNDVRVRKGTEQDVLGPNDAAIVLSPKGEGLEFSIVLPTHDGIKPMNHEIFAMCLMTLMADGSLIDIVSQRHEELCHAGEGENNVFDQYFPKQAGDTIH